MKKRDPSDGDQRQGLLWPLYRLLAAYRGSLLFVLLASLAFAITGMAGPVLTGVFVDYCLAEGRHEWVIPLLLGMGATAVLRAALCWTQQHYLLRLETRLAVQTSYEYFTHVLSLPVHFFSSRSGGEIGSRIQINDRIAHLLSGRLATNVLSILMAVLYFALMMWMDAWLGLIGLVIAVANFLLLWWVSRRRKTLNRKVLQERGDLTAISVSGLQAIETLKATGSEAEFFRRWMGTLARVLDVGQQMDVYSQRLSAASPMLSGLNMIAVLGLGAWRVMGGHMTLGELVAFQSLMASFLSPINELVALGKHLQEMEGELRRRDEVMSNDRDPEVVRRPHELQRWAGRPAKVPGQIEIRNVTFGYDRRQPPLLKGLSLSIQPGSRVALVGASGSGKSTVARLVCGLYQPWEGDILLFGQHRHQIPRQVLASSLAYVDQDIFLFEGTIRDALTMWDATIAEDDITRAARDACIHNDIAARTHAYGATVQENGANFSGGQQQRLEIARALVGNPSILVLDEATSALDATTEQQIDDNLRRRGCTCLIVAHRLSTIRDCDEIVVMDAGKIVQRGTHHDLVQDVKGRYARLIHAE